MRVKKQKRHVPEELFLIIVSTPYPSSMFNLFDSNNGHISSDSLVNPIR